MRQIYPRYVFLASKRKRNIFINVCTSEHVPRFASNGHLYMVVGSKGVTAQGVDVYDVAVHPGVLAQNDGRGFRQVKQYCRAIL